eukprot:CAMPEP_0203695982 /NCGR_PEP_ID=MMETSP0091-20130426/7289_1 /ASSEMBLY_ACC=CAM_ASM_001089 /TAXON_ID=426623 /ORGANISM="Chaetoceros affinis, Strain CCMP159" /LENGTH=296 /DNA_ID=CAMNT_0050567657 /DNA_START=71 /DNA_END=961 /DNA_ORIENTATION=+
MTTISVLVPFFILQCTPIEIMPVALAQSSPPSPPPSPSPCQDNAQRFPIPSVDWIDKPKRCGWAGLSGAKWRCTIPEVIENCPVTCNLCSSTNTSTNTTDTSTNTSTNTTDTNTSTNTTGTNTNTNTTTAVQEPLSFSPTPTKAQSQAPTQSPSSSSKPTSTIQPSSKPSTEPFNPLNPLLSLDIPYDLTTILLWVAGISLFLFLSCYRSGGDSNSRRQGRRRNQSRNGNGNRNTRNRTRTKRKGGASRDRDRDRDRDRMYDDYDEYDDYDDYEYQYDRRRGGRSRSNGKKSNRRR